MSTFLTHTIDDVIGVRWLTVPSADEHEASLRALEQFAAERGHPVVLVVVFPQELGVPSPELAEVMLGRMPRLDRCARLSLLILEGYRSQARRGNLEILEAMALTLSPAHRVCFRTSLEEALVEFPPPNLALDARKVLLELRTHGIVTR